MSRRSSTDLTTRMREQAAGLGEVHDPALAALTRIRDSYLAVPGPPPSAEVEGFLAGERPLAVGQPAGRPLRTSRWRRAVAWLVGAGLAWQVGLGSTAAFAVVTSVGIAGSLPAPAQEVFDKVLTTLSPFDRAPKHDRQTHEPDGDDPRRKAPQPTDLETRGPVEGVGYAGETDEELRQPGSSPDSTEPAPGADAPDDTDVRVPHGGGQPATPPSPGGGPHPVQPPGSGDEEGPDEGEDAEAPEEPDEEDESEDDESEDDEPEDDGELEEDDEPEEDDELEEDDR
ncbi:hypothetical protein [Nocardioides pyridinolyticus]